MTILGITRVFLQVFALCSAIIVLGLSAYVQQIYMPGYFVFDILAMVVSSLTILTLIPVLIIDRVQPNAWISWTGVELGWLGPLWAFWLGTAAYMNNFYGPISCKASDACKADLNCRAEINICKRLITLEAFTFISWIVLMIAFFTILVFGIRASSAGHSHVWRTSAAHFSRIPTATDNGATNEKADKGYLMMNDNSRHSAVSSAVHNPLVAEPMRMSGQTNAFTLPVENVGSTSV